MPFIIKVPGQASFNLTLNEVNELPEWLAEELYNLLPKEKEPTIGDIEC